MKYYKCPKCGDTITEVEYNDNIAAFGSCYCTCQYNVGNRILILYDIVKDYKVAQEIEICPKCGVFGLANGVCDYCGYDKIVANVRAQVKKHEEKEKQDQIQACKDFLFDIKSKR